MTIPSWLLDEMAKNKFNKGSSIIGQSAKVKRGEEIFEGVDYPRTWPEFVGQIQLKEQLEVAVASATARNARLDHTLLASGQHGVGKSTLATMLASAAGVGLVQAAGPIEVEKAKRLMAHMQDKDVLFIDEAHLLVAGGKNKAEWLLPFMTEGVLYTDTGALDVPNITIVAATTDAGKLPQTLLTRFMVKPKFVPYTDEEGGQIAANLSVRMGVPIDAESMPLIARAANGNPRDMRSILTAIRDLLLAFPDKPIDLDKAFDWAGFSRDGLSVIAREMLMVLSTQVNYTASIDSLQAILGEPGPLRHHEQALMQRGYLSITGRGRQLTEAGFARAEQLQKEVAA